MADISNKLGKRIVFNLVTFGFIGQVAWAVENNYFNTFLFNYIGGDSRDISRMVAWSSVVAVLTTLIMGTLSDKLNRRKIFICGGYILWGFTVMSFALISRESVDAAFGIADAARLGAVTVSIVIILDCLMTFMGSTSNDAAFNAWITDVTNPRNRAKTEGILSILPILAMVLVTVAFGVGISQFGYPACFVFLGALVVICGIIGLFSIQESRSGVITSTNYWSDLIYGFRPSVIKKSGGLYLSLAAVGFFSIATQVFLPYLFIYVMHNFDLNFDSLLENPLVIPLGIGVVALLIGGAIGAGALIDKKGKSFFVFPSVVVFIVGLVLVYFARSLAFFGLLAVIMLAGYGLLMIILNAAVRDFTPQDKVGQFQGVRMIFFVLLPMVIGPRIGSVVTEAFARGTYTNDYAEVVNVPPPEIFLASAAIAVLIFIPLVFLRKQWKAKENQVKANQA